MLSPSEFNNAVPKFTNGNYANNPVDPQYIEEPTLQDYNRGVEPLETLPAQWWNWLCNQFTSRFNKINTYVKNIFDEITQLLSLLNISPDGTESAITTGQLKNFFKELYPSYVSDKLELGTTYVPQTRTVNGHALTGNVTITKGDVGLGNVDNTSDMDKPVSTAQSTAISTAINALDVESVGGSGKYLSAISETDGKISATAGDIDSIVTANSNNLITSGGVAGAISDEVNARNTAITNAINALDVASVGGSGKYISAISETDGKISATAGDISGTVTSGDNAPVSSGAVADILSNLPTDAVLHYSFDDLPDYPDGTVDVRLLNNNTYQIQSTNYMFGINANATISNDNGNLKFVTEARGITDGVFLDEAYYNNKIIKLRLKVISLTAGGRIDILNGVSKDAQTVNIVKSITNVGTYEITFANTNNMFYKSVFIFTSEGSTSEVIVEQIYIGDGSYSTPIIDNANGQNNATNNGGIAVQGVSGKGAYFLNGKNTETNDFNFTDNFSISVWVKPDTMENGKLREIVTKNRCFYFRNGDGGSNNYLFGAFYNKSTSRYEYFHIQFTLLDNTKYTHICITKNGATVKAFVDGVLRITTNLNFTEMNKNNNSLCVNGSINDSPQSYDDLQIFDRALTETEVLALYYNKADTPKYYDLEEYKLANGDTVPTANSNNFVESKTLYNFFGGNTSANSWLGKVFGHLLGKTWSYCRFEVSNKNFNSITYGNGTWVACEKNYDIWWSYDGEEWIKGGSTTGSNSSVCYGNGIFVASCNGSTIGLWWSEDGKTWNPSGNGYEKFIKKVFYGNNMWIACTSNNDGIYWSTDGKTWTKGTGSNTSYSFNYAHYAGGLWVAGSVGNGLWWSSDGKVWTKGTGDHSKATVSSIYYANNLWVACDNYTAVSSDGKNWTQVTSNIGSTCAYFANGMWISTRTTGLMYNLQVVSDSWTEISNAPSITFNFVTYANGIWIAGGTQLWWSYDGFNWVPAGGISTVQYNYNFKCIKYANGTWVVGSDNGHGLLYSNISNIELTK